jgi:uncharacterized phage protein gp47/JayE
MTIPAPAGAAYPTPEEIRDQYLADIRYAYDQQGITVNVEPGSEHYIRAEAMAARLSIALANNEIALADSSPLTAEGEALETLCGIYGVTRRPAAYATGLVVVSTQKISATTYATVGIPQGHQCTLANGIKYETTTNTAGATNGDLVEVRAVTAGEATDAEAGDLGNWDSAAIGYLLTRVVVSATGINGGADADDDADLRRRLIRKLSRPAVGGNSAHVEELAEGATSAVWGAFVYQAAHGPASYDVAIVAEDGDRTLNTSVQSTVAAAIVAEMPGHATLNLTSVTEEQVDIVAQMAVPLPVNAGGAGGGWLDASPWPSSAETGSAPRAKITSIANLLTLSQVTVNSTSDDIPQVGQRVCLWDPDELRMHHFVVTARSGGSGAYVITLSAGIASSLSFITAGMIFSPDAVRIDDYASSVSDAMLLLGPGEKTSSADILPRARRSPSVSESAPSDMRLPVQRAITAYPEVSGLTVSSYATGTSTELVRPSVPANTTLPPRILTLKHLAFKREV